MHVYYTRKNIFKATAIHSEYGNNVVGNNILMFGLFEEAKLKLPILRQTISNLIYQKKTLKFGLTNHRLQSRNIGIHTKMCVN